MNEADPATVVFFDGSCPLCRAEMGLYRRRAEPGSLCMVDVSAAEAALPEHLDRDQAMARFHVMSRDGHLLSGAAAFAELWQQLPGWRWAARLARLPGAGPVLEAAYRLFLMVRPAVVRLFLVIRRVKTGGRVQVS